jgi:hypothetical protein
MSSQAEKGKGLLNSYPITFNDDFKKEYADLITNIFFTKTDGNNKINHIVTIHRVSWIMRWLFTTYNTYDDYKKSFDDILQYSLDKVISPQVLIDIELTINNKLKNSNNDLSIEQSKIELEEINKKKIDIDMISYNFKQFAFFLQKYFGYENIHPQKLLEKLHKLFLSLFNEMSKEYLKFILNGNVLENSYIGLNKNAFDFLFSQWSENYFEIFSTDDQATIELKTTTKNAVIRLSENKVHMISINKKLNNFIERKRFNSIEPHEFFKEKESIFSNKKPKYTYDVFDKNGDVINNNDNNIYATSIDVSANLTDQIKLRLNNLFSYLSDEDIRKVRNSLTYKNLLKEIKDVSKFKYQREGREREEGEEEEEEGRVISDEDFAKSHDDAVEEE